MIIKASELRNGAEVDSFAGKIGVDRHRLTIRYNGKTKMYELVKVVFATVKHLQSSEEVCYSYPTLSDLVRTANQVTGNKDEAIDD